jgi:hypothetical protein
MIYSSTTEVTVGQVIKAFGTQYRVTKVTDCSDFMGTPYYIVETTEMLMKHWR